MVTSDCAVVAEECPRAKLEPTSPGKDEPCGKLHEREGGWAVHVADPGVRYAHGTPHPLPVRAQDRRPGRPGRADARRCDVHRVLELRRAVLRADLPHPNRGQGPPFWAVKHPARPHKSTIQTRFTVENATLRPLQRPGVPPDGMGAVGHRVLPRVLSPRKVHPPVATPPPPPGGGEVTFMRPCIFSIENH